MPGLWEAWKAKGRLPTLPTSPLEISPTAGEIPTFPTSAGKACWKSGKPKAGFPLSHPALRLQRRFRLFNEPGGRGFAPVPTGIEIQTKGTHSISPQGPEISGSSRIGIKGRFRAPLALESNFDFRLISGLENAAEAIPLQVGYNV
jgi:hypothetical protein